MHTRPLQALKRDRDEMRRERDLLQHEVSKLATCLQYTHLGSVAAANAMSMNQVPTALQQMNATQLSQMSAASSANLLANMPQALQVSVCGCVSCLDGRKTLTWLGGCCVAP